MKKSILILLFTFSLSYFITLESKAQCIKFELAGNNLSQTLPTVNEDGTMLIFSQQVFTKIAKVEGGKFEQADNTTFTIPVKNFNPLTVNEVAADSAAAFVERTYPDIK